MTTITYRDGILASDSRAYSGGSTPIGWKQKIHQFEDGSMLGVSTTCPGLSELIMEWVQAGFDDDLMPDTNEASVLSLLYINAEGQVFYACNGLSLSGPLEGEYFAIGSGEHYALGAMAMGASAGDAVGIAKEFDVWTDGPVRTLTRNKPKPSLKAVG